MDTSWFRDTAEFFGFGSATPTSGTPRILKRKADSDVECTAKRLRFSDDTYLSSPYGAITAPKWSRPSVSPQPLRTVASSSKGVATTLPKTVVSPSPHRPSTARAEAGPSRLPGVKSRVATPAQISRPRFADSTQALPTTGTTKSTPSNKGKDKSRAVTISSTTSTSRPSPTISKSANRAQNPTKRALEVARNSTDPKKAILASVQEPEYACHDMEIRDAMWDVTDLMESFVEDHFGFVLEGKLMPAFFKQFSLETAKVIGCVASGGPGGVAGWHALFIDPVKRKALVMGIMGNVLVEQVFQHIFFGGQERDVKEMTELQKEHKDEDGFARNEQYAIRALGYLKSENISELPNNFANHVNRIVGVIYTHIKPVLALDPNAPEREVIIQAVHNIVTQAGILSLEMRIDPHTNYHFQPVFKEDSFTSETMECFNQYQMEQTNPRTDDTEDALHPDEKARRAALPAAEKKRSRNDDPLTQITILDGITAYRLGGWEAHDSAIMKVKYEKSEYANQGIRIRRLTNGLACYRWGRARRFKDGKSDDVQGHHGTAWKGGFVEFSDVPGVVDWQAIEHKAKNEKIEAMVKAAKTAAKGKGKATENVSPVRTRRVSSAKRSRRVTEADLQDELNEPDE